MLDSPIQLAQQVTPWFENPGMVGGLLGAAVGVLGGGVYGPLVGALVPRGIGKPIVMGYHYLLLAAGIALLVAGLAALMSGQPYGVWFALLLPGAILTLLMALFTPMLLRFYRQAEARRLEAEEFRRA